MDVKVVLLTSSSLPGVAYFEICSLEPVIYTFVVKFCQGNMNTVREMSGKCQGILKKHVAMNPDVYISLWHRCKETMFCIIGKSAGWQWKAIVVVL